MFAAMAVGAPVGTPLCAYGGFVAVAVATAVIPLLSLLLVAPHGSVALHRGAPVGFMKVAGAVWMPGVSSALSTVGFGAMIAFSSLLATERSWSPVWLSFSAFAFALVAARLFFGHLPDRLGEAKVALVCIVYRGSRPRAHLVCVEQVVGKLYSYFNYIRVRSFILDGAPCYDFLR